jgi:hypothetical protein
MLQGLINHSPDLKQLRDEGYDINVESTYLVVNHVPYVNGQRNVDYGTLISTLDLVGDRTTKPGNHVALWAGSYPCDSRGDKLTTLVNESNKNEKIREGLVATFSFSQKPRPEGYNDYYEKITTYVRILEGHAHAIDPNATAKTFPVIEPEEDQSVFRYIDTASSRAGISAANEKLKRGKIAIVGLGGTGGYVLDLVAKTPVEEIHLFDGDLFLQHNAFRSPGAPAIDDLKKKKYKVEWFAEVYSRMRNNIFSHVQSVDERNVGELNGMSFAFLCMEGSSKKAVVDFLIKKKIPFIDVGIGMYNNDDVLGGNARVTTCTPDFYGHIPKRIPFTGDGNDEYSRDIQIADMNALNAALAVIKWKKLSGFYLDMEREHNTTYGIITNVITNDDHLGETKNNQA